MDSNLLFLTGILACVAQSAFSAMGWTLQRRYKIQQLEGNRIIRNKIIAISCILMAAVCMCYASFALAVSLVGVFNNLNMVLVTSFAYVIIGETVNKKQICTLVGLVIFSVLAGWFFGENDASKFNSQIYLDNLKKPGVIAYLVFALLIQVWAIAVIYRKQRRLVESANKRKKQLLQLDYSADDLRRISRLSALEMETVEIPLHVQIFKALGLREQQTFWNYLEIFLGVHLTAFPVALHCVLLKLVQHSAVNGEWAIFGIHFAILVVSYPSWLLFTGWSVCCFDANFVTPLFYALGCTLQLLDGMLFCGDMPERSPAGFYISATLMVTCMAIFAFLGGDTNHNTANSATDDIVDEKSV